MTVYAFQDRVMDMNVHGIVIHGDGFGKKLGYPTANIDREAYQEKKLDLKHGVYAGMVERKNGDRYVAGIVVGPVDDTGLPKLEAHLLDFDDDLYGEQLTFMIGDFLRPFENYETIDAIKDAIAADIAAIRKLSLDT